jgi:D-alanine-D-alanine ligase-like ATP-grasp enzyme
MRRNLRPSAESVPSHAPIERFVRDILPRVPGGPHEVPECLDHPTLIRRAGKARGLSTKKVENTIYLYAGRHPVGGVQKTKNGLNSPTAIAICRSKYLSKQMFRAAGLPTPAGIALEPDQFDQALEHVQATRGTWVLKPLSEQRGEGVTVGIATEDDLRAAWKTAGQAAQQVPAFLLEEQIDGIDVRVHVAGRRVVAAITRLPAHVVGDGRRAITDLVDSKQQQRDQHAYMSDSPMIVNPVVLARAGWDMHDVPDDGDVVLLNGPANVGAGGEAVDVTGLVHPDLLSLAIDASRAIPGLRNTGVDLLAPDLDTVDGAVVLEANHWPDILVHHYPAYGRPRDVAGAIVDEMVAASGLPARKPHRPGVARRVARAARRRLRA